MPTKILLADDSMTAQKMGKEILISAGYEVVAVSNGAAAAKKLGDKYGCIILDINMPGYTGFELCEKVRANMDIAKTPVLLTIGKMEHYEPTEVQRVKADGVIIKPFEATDLIATIQKLMEKAAPAPDKTVTLEKKQVEDFKDQSYNDWKQESEPVEEAPKKNTLEMSHAEASAPAFGMDMDEHLAAAAPVEAAPAMVPPAFQAPAFTESPAAPAFAATPSLAPIESERIENLMQAAPPVAMVEEQHTISIAPPSFSAPASGRDPMFDAPGSDDKGDGYAIPVKDPALAAHVEINSPEFVAKNAPEPPPAHATEDDFEARVAAAMSSGFEEEHELVEAEPEEIPEAAQEEPEAAAEVVEPVIERTQPIEAQTPQMPPMMAEPPEYERTIKIQRPADLEISAQTATLSSEEEIAPDPMIERSYEAPVVTEAAPVIEAPIQAAPAVDEALVEQMHAAVQEMEVAPHVEEPMPEPAQVAQATPPTAPAPTTGHDLELANALAAAVGGEAPSAMAAAASAGMKPNVTVADPNLIAAAVHRAMAKMMPAIMSEVAKELDPEKK